jgi:glutathione-specific gamma-glutamylcyclotransferase
MTSNTTPSHWVFAYGSLIWRPGFAFLHAEPATLQGWHRSLCVLSHVYRGTEERQGLVFGLDVGGTCHGLAYEVAAMDWPETHRYLTERELITNVYKETLMSVSLPRSLRRVKALTYVVGATHPQYTGPMSRAQKLDLIRQGVGEAGTCIDYVRTTMQHLHELGIPDPALDDLVNRL